MEYTSFKFKHCFKKSTTEEDEFIAFCYNNIRVVQLDIVSNSRSFTLQENDLIKSHRTIINDVLWVINSSALAEYANRKGFLLR